jgi:hypothetical protein
MWYEDKSEYEQLVLEGGGEIISSPPSPGIFCSPLFNPM